MEQEELAKTCQNCTGLLRCRLLADEKGRFDLKRLITEENPRHCEEWTPVGHRAKSSRDRLYQMSGVGSLRALHELPQGTMDDLRRGEEDEIAMYEDTPDFRRMINDGVTTVPEREELLRYKTDEEGNFTETTAKDGEIFRVPQETFHLRQYAADPKGPIQLGLSNVMYWTTNQLIDHILKVEVEQDLIIKTKGKTSKKVKSKTKPVKAKEPKKMAEGRKVRVNRTSGGGGGGQPARTQGKTESAGGGGEGRVSRPTRRTGAPASAGNGATDPGQSSANVGDLPEAVAALVNELVEKQLVGLKADLLEAIAELRTTNLQAVTILHDMLVQTGGSMAFPREDDQGKVVLDEEGNEIYDPLPELCPKPSKILAYTDGTAFEGSDEAQGEAQSPT